MRRLLYILIIFNLQSIAQKEPNIWYFGNDAGINFNQSPPVALTNGVMNQFEGCASIADRSTGALLFYTGGDTVWNSTHSPMPNGTGLFGHLSSTQSAVIVPMPGDTTKIYIFTADQGGYYAPPNRGINYSIVDMTLNGGLGDVTVKNILLLQPATEKLTAVHHCNGTDIWVITHQWDSDAFYAYLVSDTGISSPIISNAGSVHWNVNGNGLNWESLGYLKAAPNGKKLALAIGYIPDNDVELFDFDKTTGIVSNVVYLPTDGWAYGISFSPDNSKLYVTFASGGKLLQYDLLAGGGEPDSIRASKTAIFTLSVLYGALQIAPDGKIYVARVTNDYLGLINAPNAVGLACDYIEDGFYLDGQLCFYGLPGFIESYFDTGGNTSSTLSLYLGEDTTLCQGETLLLDADNPGAAYLWLYHNHYPQNFPHNR